MTLTGPADTLPDLLQDAARRHRERMAVVDGANRLRYYELLELAEDYAGVLRSLGVRRGDRVGIALPRSVGAVGAFFGAALAGAIAVPVGERLKPAQVAQMLLDADPRVVVTDARSGQLLRDFTAPGVGRVVVSQDGRPADRLLALDDSPGGAGAVPIGKDLAALMYTSGSTGPPKGIMVTHENLAWGGAIVAAYLGLTREDRLVTALPLSFDYGLNQVLSAIQVGGCVVVERSTHPAALCRTIEREGVTGLAGVPFLWKQMAARHSPFFTRPLPSLRYLTNSGGLLAPEIVRRIRTEKPHVDLFLMYGLTEAFRSTYLEPSEVDRRPTSIGRAIPNVEILVLDQHGNLCAAGETGELVHRGPTVAAGFWGHPEATARTFRRRPLAGNAHETVVYSGDLVRADEDGFLYFVGRRDALFKSRGIRVNPEEIEAELQRCPLVTDAVVLALTGADVGAEPAIIAVLVALPQLDAATVVEEFCRCELPAHMRPTRLKLVAAIPTTPNGKPDRGRARELWGGPAPGGEDGR